MWSLCNWLPGEWQGTRALKLTCAVAVLLMLALIAHQMSSMTFFDMTGSAFQSQIGFLPFGCASESGA